jgi:pimeloyl-ACP methyl ester carboxylesterase
VLIHGAAGSSVAWMDVVRRASGRRRVIAPDLPGHGQSVLWDEVSLDVYRDFVGTVCATLGIAQAVLVGHSMGGAIALRCALAWPERVAGLVLVGTGARLKVAPALHELLARDLDAYAEQYRAWAFSPSTPPDLVDRWMAVAVQADQATCAADYRALDGFDERPRLAGIKVPSLVICGADDLLTPPKLSYELAAGLPNARVEVVAHAGHHVAQERPDAFHAAFDPFLAEVP